jgi:hypothetical protein
MPANPRHWDFAHNPNRPGRYLGFAHRACNRGAPDAHAHLKRSPSARAAARRKAAKSARPKSQDKLAQRETQRQGRLRRGIILPSHLKPK